MGCEPCVSFDRRRFPHNVCGVNRRVAIYRDSSRTNEPLGQHPARSRKPAAPSARRITLSPHVVRGDVAELTRAGRTRSTQERCRRAFTMTRRYASRGGGPNGARAPQSILVTKLPATARPRARVSRFGLDRRRRRRRRRAREPTTRVAAAFATRRATRASRGCVPRARSARVDRRILVARAQCNASRLFRADPVRTALTRSPSPTHRRSRRSAASSTRRFAPRTLARSSTA